MNSSLQKYSGIKIQNLRKTFNKNNVIACDNVNLDVAEGELLVLLGPSGCGKTTTLRCIAGLEHPDNENAIIVKGEDLTRVIPKDRNMAFVFQNTALFPHLNVRKNISFGLDMKKNLTKEEINQKVISSAEMLKINDLLYRYPRELSGGQGQRVALGRAIVMEPTAFLLDEPFAALDAKLRVEMRTEIKLIQRNLNTTMIFVTHDQEEALTIGDKIAVMNEGVVQQYDTPFNIYYYPKNEFVANFIGSPPINQFECTFHSKNYLLNSKIFNIKIPEKIQKNINDERIILGIRPESIKIGDNYTDVKGQIKLIELMGSRTLILIDCEGIDIKVLVQGVTNYSEGENVSLKFDTEQSFYFNSKGENLINFLN